MGRCPTYSSHDEIKTAFGTEFVALPSIIGNPASVKDLETNSEQKNDLSAFSSFALLFILFSSIAQPIIVIGEIEQPKAAAI